jgi:hypothetical protein
MTHPVTGAPLPPLFFRLAAEWNNAGDPLSMIFLSPPQRQEKTLWQNVEYPNHGKKGQFWELLMADVFEEPIGRSTGRPLI